MVWNAIFLDFARYWGFTRGIGPDSSSILPSPGACCWVCAASLTSSRA
jgi:hypothetical protein